MTKPIIRCQARCLPLTEAKARLCGKPATRQVNDLGKEKNLCDRHYWILKQVRAGEGRPLP